MNAGADAARVAARLIAEELSEAGLQSLDSIERGAVLDALFASSAGRRWLRQSSLLDQALADRLLGYADDYNQERNDSTLAAVVECASLARIVEQAPTIAAGAGAPALWTRLMQRPGHFQAAIERVMQEGKERALTATATHLLLDPAEQIDLSAGQRQAVAMAIIDSRAAAARAVAAEHLAITSPATLAGQIGTLGRDPVASVRGFAWYAAFRCDREEAMAAATALLGDESIGPAIRLTALDATGEHLPTTQVVGLLTYFVVHPNPDLALAAANLLHRQHRHPEIAMTAIESPHDEVRQIAARLMDPYRGSPAAGGSRPGDPLRADPLLQLMRQLEEEETGE